MMRTLVIAIVAALGLAACQATPPERTNPAADEFPGGFEVDPGLPPDRPM